MEDQLSWAAWLRPAVSNRCRTVSSVATTNSPSAMESVSLGSTWYAADPVLGTSLATTGAPASMASTGGRPKPSISGT